MSTQGSVTAAILCGGQGTRLRPVIGEYPKCLAMVADHPFLFYILDHLYGQGVRRFVFCTGYEGEMVMISVESHWGKTKDLHWSHEEKPLGTGGALRNALPLLDTDPVLVVNGDTYCPFNLEPLLRHHRDFGWEATVVAGRGNAGWKGWAGVYLLNRKVIEGFRDLPLDEHLLGQQSAGGGCVLRTGFPFLDIGTPEGYAAAPEFLRKLGVVK